MHRIFSGLLFALCLTACASTPPQFPPATAADTDVLQTLAAAALDDWAKNGLPVEACCLRVDGHTTSAALLSKLPASTPPLQDSTGCRQLRSVGGYSYQERSSGGRAVVIHVSILKWVSPTTVEGSYGWDHSAFAGRSCSVRLTLRDGRWVVTDVLFAFQS